MNTISLFLIAVGLSMDAFAVAVCKGLNMHRINYKHAVIIAAFFGLFQAGMPLIGWMLGRQFEKYITEFDHWIAFALLAFIGGKMIYEALRPCCDEQEEDDGRLNIKELLVLSVATSIDALAVGITFAFLNTSVWTPVALIGCTTFVLSFIGVIIGNNFGSRYKAKAELSGGVILVLMGVKILLEHLNVI